jgi:hypothetical protein
VAAGCARLRVLRVAWAGELSRRRRAVGPAAGLQQLELDVIGASLAVLSWSALRNRARARSA